MPAYISWVNHADSATTITTTTSGAMLRPLTELAVPWAKGLCRGPANGGASTPAHLTIRGYWASGITPHYIGIIGLNGTAAVATLRMSYVSASSAEIYNISAQFTPFLSGTTNPLGAAIWFPMPSFTVGTVRYIEIYIEVYDLPAGYRHVDCRRLLIMSGGGSELGFDRGWSIITEDTSKDVQTPKGGVFIDEEQSSRIMQFSMTGRKSVEMREAVRGFYSYDSLERVLTSAGKRKEVIVCPRYYAADTDAYRNTIYGRLQSWTPIVHEMGELYGCEQVIVKEIPYPPL